MPSAGYRIDSRRVFARSTEDDIAPVGRPDRSIVVAAERDPNLGAALAVERPTGHDALRCGSGRRCDGRQATISLELRSPEAARMVVGRHLEGASTRLFNRSTAPLRRIQARFTSPPPPLA